MRCVHAGASGSAGCTEDEGAGGWQGGQGGSCEGRGAEARGVCLPRGGAARSRAARQCCGRSHAARPRHTAPSLHYATPTRPNMPTAHHHTHYNNWYRDLFRIVQRTFSIRPVRMKFSMKHVWDGTIAAVVAEFERFVKFPLSARYPLGLLNLCSEVHVCQKVSKVCATRHACAERRDWSLRTHVYLHEPSFL